MSRVFRSLRSFARDESGVILAEFLILLPLLIWGFLALFVYWDVYRTINVSQKAAYSIADLLSRQQEVTPQFVNGLQEVLTFLTPDAEDSRMVVTSFDFHSDGGAHYHLLFSCSPENKVAQGELQSEASLLAMMSQIPVMNNLDSMLLVETWVDFRPKFDIGVLNFTPGLESTFAEGEDHMTLTQSVMTRPRIRHVCMAGSTDCRPTCG